MIRYEDYESSGVLNWYTDDPLLPRYAKRYLSQAMLRYVEATFERTGALAAGPIDRRAVHTDRDGSPKLIRYNRKGEEINEVWYNEGYLQTVQDGYGTGVVAYRYDNDAPETVPFWVNAILLYILCEAEPGFTCPVGLTQSAAFVLEKFGSESQKAEYLTRLASLDPDEFAQGATFLTEIQGGSDVGATQTVAVKEGDHYRLTGEKWFASNCDADIAIALARVNDQPSTRGLGLFVMPRVLPDGSKNRVTIRRLKDKLGVRAVASGELILNGAIGYLIGEESSGFKYMAEALNVSRLGTALAGLAAARRAWLEAAIYTSQRVAFGNPVSHYPMVRETLTDIAVEVEAGWAVAAQMLRRFDEVHTFGEAAPTGRRDGAAAQGSGTPPSDAGSVGASGSAESNVFLLRILLSLAKLRCSELGVQAAKRAMELHGGNGYIEEYVTPRLLRDALVQPIWEGTANIQALEVLKNLGRGGARPFVEDLEETLASVIEPELQDLRATLEEQVAQCGRLVEHVLGQSAEVQSGLAKKLAERMYDVFAAVHLLEEAQYDVQVLGDKRRLMVAAYWSDRALGDGPDADILGSRIVDEDVFAAIVGFREVPVEVRTGQ